MQLSIGSKLKFSPDLKVTVSDVYDYDLYSGETLQGVLDEIDLLPDDYETVDVEEILSEIEYEDSYDDILETELDSKSRNFLSEFLKGVNESLLANYEGGTIEGEDTFYDLVYFDGNGNEESLAKLKEIYALTGSDEVQKIIKAEIWDSKENVFYIIHFSTEVNE